MSTTGERIKKARKDAGLTQAELAQACEVATITIQQYERDKRMPNQEMLRIIADKLKINWLYLANIDMPFRPDNLEDAKKMYTEYVRYRTISDAIESIISAMFGKVERNVYIDDFGVTDVYKGGSLAYGNCSALFDAEAYYHIEDEIQYIIKKNCCLYDNDTGSFMRIQYEPPENDGELQLLDIIVSHLHRLNVQGLQKVVERIEELVELPKYLDTPTETETPPEE